MSSNKQTSRISPTWFLAVVTCVVVIVVVTQLNDGAANEPAKTYERLSTPLAGSWGTCLNTLSNAEPKDSLLNTYPISNDAFIAQEDTDFPVRDLDSPRTSKSANVLSKVTDAIKTMSQHKSLVLGDTGYLVFPSNLVVTADIPSCTIQSVHLPQQSGDVHADVFSTIEENKHLVREDRKRKSTPRPTRRANARQRPKVPCTIKGTPRGCAHRIRKWNQIKNNPLCRPGSKTFIGPNTKGCAKFANRDRIRSNLCNGKQYCVQFRQGRFGQKYGIIMQAGESWGPNPINKRGDYDCMGRCGPGCNGFAPGLTFCSNWGRQCMRHDVCGWFFGAGDKRWNILVFDKNCRYETVHAGRDQFNNCLSREKPCKGPHKRITKCRRVR